MVVTAGRAGRRAALAGAGALLLATTACSGTGCRFDACPDVPTAEAGTVVASDPSGAVRWRTTVADLLARPPVVSNGHVVLVGCHATHVVDMATGTVATPTDLADVIGIVDGYAVGAPSAGDAAVAAQRLDGRAGGWSWQESPVDAGADRDYRASAVVTTDAVVGVRLQTLVAWKKQAGSWASTEVALPVGAARGLRLVAADDAHVAVPGADGSVIGTDLVTGAVTWRSLPTRPDAPAGLAVHLDGDRVGVEVWYPQTSAPAITGEAVWVTERWSLDPRTGAVVSPRTTVTGPRDDHRDVAATEPLRDPASGWTVTQRLREPPHGGCF